MNCVAIIRMFRDLSLKRLTRPRVDECVIGWDGRKCIVELTAGNTIVDKNVFQYAQTNETSERLAKIADKCMKMYRRGACYAEYNEYENELVSRLSEEAKKRKHEREELKRKREERKREREEILRKREERKRERLKDEELLRKCEERERNEELKRIEAAKQKLEREERIREEERELEREGFLFRCEEHIRKIEQKKTQRAALIKLHKAITELLALL